VVIHKKLFQFLLELIAKVPDRLNVCPTVGVTLDAYDAIIPLFLFARSLQTLYDTDGPAREHTAGECRFIHKHQDVDWIAVIRFSGRHESEVVGKGHAGGQDLFEEKDVLVWVERELVSASLWCFDHDPEKTLVVAIFGFQICRVRQRSGFPSLLRHLSLLCQMNWMQSVPETVCRIRRTRIPILLTHNSKNNPDTLLVIPVTARALRVVFRATLQSVSRLCALTVNVDSELQDGGVMATKKKSRSKPRYGAGAKKAVGSAMRRKKKGTLRSGKAGKGGKVKSRKQAIAIGLSEARKKGAKVPRKS
jgi:hypothetical protein